MNYYLLLFLLIVLIGWKYNIREGFQREFCPDCNNNGWSGKDYCQRCINCGWSVGWDDYGQCIPGSLSNPITNNNTKHWYYGGKKIWSTIHHRNFQRPRKEVPVIISSPHLQQISSWERTHYNRTRYGYGSPRYGLRFGYGWDNLRNQQLT